MTLKKRYLVVDNIHSWIMIVKGCCFDRWKEWENLSRTRRNHRNSETERIWLTQPTFYVHANFLMWNYEKRKRNWKGCMTFSLTVGVEQLQATCSIENENRKNRVCQHTWQKWRQPDNKNWHAFLFVDYCYTMCTYYLETALFFFLLLLERFSTRADVERSSPSSLKVLPKSHGKRNSIIIPRLMPS